MTMLRPGALLRISIPIWAIILLFVYLRRDRTSPPNLSKPSPNIEIAIPRTIHQLLISMPAHPVSTFKPNTHSISWMQSGWKVEYWSEESCLDLALEIDITYAETFQQLPNAVLRSDFCRYLVMFGRGGLYNDLDVHLMQPLPWKAMGSVGGYDPPSLIIGVEGDATTKGLPRSPQFVQWTIASKPAHPLLKKVLDLITERTPSLAKKAKQDKSAELDIMNWTGPSVWTDAVLEHLGSSEDEISNLRNLKEFYRIKDILILPKRSFAIIQGENHKSPDILAKHYFSGTWKTCKHQGLLGKLLPWGC